MSIVSLDNEKSMLSEISYPERYQAGYTLEMEMAADPWK
jgi:hypothetical protein